MQACAAAINQVVFLCVLEYGSLFNLLCAHDKEWIFIIINLTNTFVLKKFRQKLFWFLSMIYKTKEAF